MTKLVQISLISAASLVGTAAIGATGWVLGKKRGIKEALNGKYALNGTGKVVQVPAELHADN